MASSLSANWRFDEGAGTVANDSSGNGNSGMISNATWTTGFMGSALHFNANPCSDVSVSNSAALNPTAALTVAAWVKADSWTAHSSSDNPRIIGKSNPEQFALIVQHGAFLRFFLRGVTGGDIQTTAPPTAGVWHHVAGTYDGSTIRIYVDGLVATQQLASGSIAIDSGNLVIGGLYRSSNNVDYFDGTIDDVWLYGRALSSSEIAGISCAYSLSPTSANVGTLSGNGSFTVTAQGGCSWSAGTSASWLHTSSTGSGNGSVNYTFDANGDTSPRSGTISVGGQNFTINQAGTGQVPWSDVFSTDTINNYSVTYWPYAGGSATPSILYDAPNQRAIVQGVGGYGNIVMEKNGESPISASSDFTFSADVSILNEYNGYLYLGDNRPIPPIGATGTGLRLNIGNWNAHNCNLQIYQNGASVTDLSKAYTPQSSNNVKISRVNGQYSFYVNNILFWTQAIPSLDGMDLYWGVGNEISSGPSGITAETAVDNIMLALTGPCNYSLSPTSANVGTLSSSGSFGVIAPAGCGWSASTGSSWLQTSSSGSGNGTVNYTFDANGGASSRSGTISAGNQSFTVNQAGRSNRPPIITSAPTVVNPLVRVTNDCVQGIFVVVAGDNNGFTVGAVDPDGNPLSYQWSFGDGFISDWAASGTAVHAYTPSSCVSSYVAQVTVSNGLSQISSSVTVAPACELKVSRQQAKLNFTPKPNADSCSLSATLDLGPGFNAAYQTMTLDIGGVQLCFQLDYKGRGVSNYGTCRLTYNKKTGVWTLTANLRSGDWQTPWANYGLINDTTVKTVSLPVTVVIGNDAFAGQRDLLYKATVNKSGTAK